MSRDTKYTERKPYRGKCADCGHYDIGHGQPCNGYDQYGRCPCPRWVSKIRPDKSIEKTGENL